MIQITDTDCICLVCTECSFNIVFFPKILEYSGLLPLSVFTRYQCVYTHLTGRTPALQQNWQSSEKKTIFNEHPVVEDYHYRRTYL